MFGPIGVGSAASDSQIVPCPLAGCTYRQELTEPPVAAGPPTAAGKS